MKTIIRLVLIIGVSVNVACSQNINSSDAIIGTWLVQDGTAKVKIEKSNGKFFGKLVWIKSLHDKGGQPLLDTKNPDKSLQSRPQLGLKLLENFAYDSDNVWTDGTIYDPDSGKTYSCKITMKNNETMEVRGYVGISLFGRTDTWKRSQDMTMK